MADYPTALAAYGASKFHKFSNLCKTTLAADIVGTPATFAITSASTATTWEADNFVALVRKPDGTESELIFVSSRSSTTCTIGTRGLGGTSTQDHDAGDEVLIVTTAEFLEYLIGEVMAMQAHAGVAGPLVHASVTTTPYTATSSDAIIPVDATSASATVNLPTAVGLKGRMYVIGKTDASVNTVTIDADGTETIGGSLTKVLTTQNSFAVIYSDGANWLLISSGSGGGGGLTWTEVTGTSQTADPDNGYITNNASLVTVTLPTTCAVGEIVEVQGKGAGKWKIAQSSGQTIHTPFGDSTTGTGGNVSANHRYDNICLICIMANTDFAVKSYTGTPVVT